MDTINYRIEGNVFDIQRFSIHDGPGVRTIVFLKGCPLTCLWCSNPESQKLKSVLMYQSMNCIHCGKCISACKVNAISNNSKGFIDRNICTSCGECVNVCPTGALTIKGKKMTVEQVIKELKKDEIIYRRSGGGITFSGGEPLVQSKFLKELLKACKSQGWHTAIETTAYSSKEVVEEIFPYIDLALMDIKGTNPEKHKKYTGVSNEIIIENAKLVSQISNMVVRVPLVPEVNSSREDILGLCNLVKNLKNVDTIHLLPYHTYGENKYDLLGIDYLMKNVKSLKEEEIQSLKVVIENEGIRCVIGG